MAEEKWVDPRVDLDWTEKVLEALVARNEKFVIDGKPTTKGLREYIKTFCKVVESYPIPGGCVGVPHSDPDHALRGAWGSYRLVIELPNGDRETWGGAADAFPDNLQGRFRCYPTAMADTRSEGRALVRALNLRCITYDEVAGSNNNDLDEEDMAPASPIQWEKFDRLFKEYNINPSKFFSLHAKAMGVTKVSEITKHQAIQYFEKLNFFKQGNAVPEAMSGYDKKWLEKVKV